MTKAYFHREHVQISDFWKQLFTLKIKSQKFTVGKHVSKEDGYVVSEHGPKTNYLTYK